MHNRVHFVLENISGKTLDVGHCVGPLHDLIVEKAGQDNVYGLDLEVKKPTKRNIKGSAEKMPFKANFFDTVVAGELIEHLPNPEKFVKESRRVLKNKGTILITTPNVKSFVNMVTKSYHAPAHLHLFTKEELLALLKKHGFSVVKYSAYPYTEESSSGSKYPIFFILRKTLNALLPVSMREQMAVVAQLKK